MWAFSPCALLLYNNPRKEFREMKKVLLFGFQDFVGITQAASLAEKLGEIGAEVRTVGPEEYKERIGELCYGEKRAVKVSESQAAALPARMLVFCGLTSEELEKALPLCRACGITRDDLKAVLTPDNVMWTGEQLMKELMEEHAAMKK